MHWNDMNSTQRWAYGGTAIAILAVAGALLFGHKHRSHPPAVVAPVEMVEVIKPPPQVAPAVSTVGPTCPLVAKAAPKGLPTPAKPKPAKAKKVEPQKAPRTRHYGRGRGDDAVLP